MGLKYVRVESMARRTTHWTSILGTTCSIYSAAQVWRPKLREMMILETRIRGTAPLGEAVFFCRCCFALGQIRAVPGMCGSLRGIWSVVIAEGDRTREQLTWCPVTRSALGQEVFFWLPQAGATSATQEKPICANPIIIFLDARPAQAALWNPGRLLLRCPWHVKPGSAAA